MIASAAAHLPPFLYGVSQELFTHEIRSKCWRLFIFGALIFLGSEQRSFTTPRLTLPQAAAGWKIEGTPQCAKLPLPSKFQVGAAQRVPGKSVAQSTADPPK